MNHGSRVLLAIVVVAVAALGIWLFMPESTVDTPREPTVLEKSPKVFSEDIVGERMADTNYVAALRELTEERRAVIVKVATVRREMGDLLTGAAEELQDEELASTNKVMVLGLDEIPEPLFEKVQQHPEWEGLETRLVGLVNEQESIQVRTKSLIQGRMNEQYAARMAAATDSPIRPPANVVRVNTNLLDVNQQTPMVITNMPTDGAPLPALPERKPVQ